MIDKLVSIVIPVYNGEKFVHEAIYSCRNQTYDNIEIIVINDGSTDNTIETIKKASGDDMRVRVISVANGGPARARNIGLDNAKGEFLLFLDADDTIDLNAVEILLSEVSREEKFDFIIFGFKVYKGGVLQRMPNPGNLVFRYQDDIDSFEEIRKLMPSPCNKLYRREYINCRFKENLVFAEDSVFTFETLHKDSAIIAVDKCLYNVQLGTSNSVNKRYLSGKLRDFIFAAETEERKLMELFKESFCQSKHRKTLIGSFGVIITSCIVSGNLKDFIHEYEQVKTKELCLYLLNEVEDVRFLEKIIFILLRKEYYDVLQVYCKCIHFMRNIKGRNFFRMIRSCMSVNVI